MMVEGEWMAVVSHICTINYVKLSSLQDRIFVLSTLQMPSPAGTYVGFTRAELVALRAEMLDRLTNGKRTSGSGGGKSYSKSVPASSLPDIQQALAEINYALNRLDPQRKIRAATVYVNSRFEKPYGTRGIYNTGQY